MNRLRRWWTASIRRQLMLGVALVHAVLMSVFIVDLALRQQDFLRRQIHDQALALAQTLADNSIPWLLADDVAGLEEVVRSVTRHPHLAYAYLIDPEGRVTSADPGETGRYLDDPASLELLARPAIAPHWLVDDEALVDVAVPVRRDGRHLGWARVALDLTATRAALAAVVRDGLLYALAAIAVGLLFAAFMARGITAGLSALVQVAEQVRAGRRSARARLERPDELGILARDLNLMLDQLQEEERAAAAAHAELAAEKQRFQTMFEALPDAVALIDTEGRVRLVNPAAERIFALPREKILGRPVARFYARRREYLHHMARLSRLRETRAIGPETVHYRDGDGREFVGEVVSTVLRDPQGHVQGFLCIARDVSERERQAAELARHRERLEEKVAQRTAELEASNRELEAFSYAIAHDLRAPLRAITSFSQIVLEDAGPRLDEADRDALRRVVDAARRMARQIDDILDLARLSRAPLERREVDLSQLAREVAEELARAHPDQAADIHIQPDIRVQGDARLLRQALQNLLENAWKFSPGVPHIRLAGHLRKGHWEICLSDRGVGFDPAYADKLFQPFARLHSEEEFPGTGIGLATVARIVQRHGGEIRAQGRPGRGARFCLTLPAPPAPRPHDARAPRRR